MKRILLALTVLLVFMLVGCEVTTEKTDYRDMMMEIEPKEIEINLLSSSYATHEFIINEKQTLYYFPQKVTIGDNIYINDKTGYFVITEDDLLSTSEQVDLSYLKLLFSSGSE